MTYLLMSSGALAMIKLFYALKKQTINEIP